MITTIFFDVGHVLLERIVDPIDVVAKEWQVDPEKLRRVNAESVTRKDLKHPWSAIRDMTSEAAFSNEVGRLNMRAFGIEPTNANLEAYRKAWMERTNRLMPNAHETLRYLSNKYRLAILSNASPSRRHELSEHDLMKYFDPIIISREVGHEKPAAEIFELALRLADASGGESAFVDDREENLDAAEQAGFALLILFNWQEGFVSKHRTITDLSELRQIL